MQSDFSNLHPNLVLDFVENFGYEVTGQSYPLNSYENRVFQVALEGGGFVVAKFYRPLRWSKEQIIEEHAFSNELHGAGVQVANNLTNATGNSLASIEGYACSLQSKISGRSPELEDLDSLFQIGQVLGKFHSVTKDYKFTYRDTYNPQKMGADNAEFLKSEWLPKKQLQHYSKIADQILEKIENILPADLSSHFIATHGDCHLSNVLMTESSPVLLDFDDAMMAPAVQDIWMFLSGDSQQQKIQLSELIEGYEESIKFPAYQLDWIPAMRSLRVINYTAWLAKRWQDPAFPLAFPWFNSEDFWASHVKELQQLSVDFDLNVKATVNKGGNF